MMNKILLAGSMLGLSISGQVFAEDAEKRLDPLSVVGVAGGEDNVAGSVSYISEADLDALNQSDLLRVLHSVPGVNIQEEEGYGLRPNIGLRGSGSDRSSRIMLLEDGIPIAPAVYAAPSAYYFPNFTRMRAVEITKGPGVIQYGPRTTGGAVHLFSTEIPDQSSGKLEYLFGDYGRQRLYANAGTRFALSEDLKAGLLIETVQDEADGFLVRDNGGATGFDISDYLIKAGLFGDGAMPWSLILKYQTKTETSEQTYLGLTEFDYAASPYRLYPSTVNDDMNNENELFQLTGEIAFSADTTLAVTAYHNDITRNWYKVQGVSDTGNGASDDRGISSILDNPYNPDGTLSDDYLILTGGIARDDSIVLRANNRAYQSRGVQGVLTHKVVFSGMAHTLTGGVRYHEDYEDRFQTEDAYRLENGQMMLTTAGLPGQTTNRLTSADAISAFVMDRVDVTDRLSVTLGVRYEDYEITRDDFSTSDPSRANGPTRTRVADSSILLPSVSALFDLTDDLTLLGGVHKGFSPIGATDTGAEDEIAWNYEIGGRYQKDDVSVEVIVYLNDYENLLGECTNSTGSFCSAGQAFNGGEFEARGLEVTAEWEAASVFGLERFELPIGFAYTYTETVFQTSFDNAFFGDVELGDELNYVPEHQVSLNAGLVADKWAFHAGIHRVSEARGTIGSGPIPANDVIDGRTLVDASAWYDVTDNLRLRIQAENLFDERYIAARRPAGIRPGKPQEVLIGFALSF